MAEPIKVRIITKEEQESKYKMIVYLFVVGFLIFLLYLSYNYIRTLGFNHNSTIALMISAPLILLICIFKGKKIYWSIKSLSQDNYHKNKYRKQNRKGFFWLLMIGLLILIILFLQFYPSVSKDFSSQTKVAESSIYEKISIGMSGADFYNLILGETALFAPPTTNKEVTFNYEGFTIKVFLSDSLHIQESENNFRINDLTKIIKTELYRGNTLVKQKG